MYIFIDHICNNKSINDLMPNLSDNDNNIYIQDVMINSYKVELEKQYHIILFIRELLDNPTDKYGNPLSEAKLFAYLRQIICVLDPEKAEIQDEFYKRL